jgi:hypothetical protein
MGMHVKYSMPMLQGPLQSLPYGFPAHHCADGWVLEIVLVLDRPIGPRECDYVSADVGEASRDETDAFVCKGMGPRKVPPYSTH